MENKEKIDVLAKVLAAASIIATASDPELQKLGIIIGEGLCELIPKIEGVEQNEQFGYLTEHGCMTFQGYLFGRPMPLAEFEQRLIQASIPLTDQA